MNMSPESGGGGGSSGMGTGGLLGSMGGGGAPGLGGSGSGGGANNMGSLNAESPYDATVDIYGIIYIYNPVDPAKLESRRTSASTPPAAPATRAGAPV